MNKNLMCGVIGFALGVGSVFAYKFFRASRSVGTATDDSKK